MGDRTGLDMDGARKAVAAARMPPSPGEPSQVRAARIVIDARRRETGRFDYSDGEGLAAGLVRLGAGNGLLPDVRQLTADLAIQDMGRQRATDLAANVARSRFPPRLLSKVTGEVPGMSDLATREEASAVGRGDFSALSPRLRLTIERRLGEVSRGRMAEMGHEARRDLDSSMAGIRARARSGLLDQARLLSGDRAVRRDVASKGPVDRLEEAASLIRDRARGR